MCQKRRPKHAWQIERRLVVLAPPRRLRGTISQDTFVGVFVVPSLANTNPFVVFLSFLFAVEGIPSAVSSVFVDTSMYF